MTDKIEPTYVYTDSTGSVEVRLTGRTAEKKLTSGRINILHEFSPVNTIVGTWKNWIELDKLSKVVQ